MSDVWGSDAPVSKPAPPNREVAVSFGGFAFTTGGVVHEVTEAEIEEAFFPVFAPEGFDGR